MISKGIKKYLLNPSLGLLSSIFYIGLFLYTDDIAYSLLVSIIFSALFEIVLRISTKSGIYGLIFLVNLFALTGTFIFWFILSKSVVYSLFYLIFYEILFSCLIFVTRLSKTYLNIHFRKNNSLIEKTYLNESFEVLRLAQYGFTSHLFIVLLFLCHRENSENIELWGNLFFFFIPIIICFMIITYEEIKTKKIVKNLRREEWLPIVNEAGEVTGRIAKSVSLEMKNKFLHPVVRIALIHNNELYLQKRAADDSIDPCTYDHPFEKYMLLDHEINTAARNSIKKSLGMNDLPFRFLLKYVYEDDNTKRLVFLFVSRLENEDQLNSIRSLKGKFWTMKQIEEDFGDNGLFSECFQLEYEYLKNTVLRFEIAKKEVPFS